MSNSSRLNRRQFLASTVALATSACFPISFSGCVRVENVGAVELLSWITIDQDNVTTLRIPQTEIGQAVTTTVSQLLSEELEADWNKITTEFFDPSVNLERDNVYVWTATLSSLSANLLFDPTRIAGAQIKAMLLEAASTRLGVSAAELQASNSMIVHGATGRKLRYADVAYEAADLTPPAPDTLTLKTPEQWRLIGKSVEKLDLASKVDGSTLFGIDVELPGMKYAAIRQSPVFGGKLKSFDADTLRNLPGVHSTVSVSAAFIGYNSPVEEGQDPDLYSSRVEMDDAVAVVADKWWQAKKALDTLPIDWDDGPNSVVSSESITGEFGSALEQTQALALEEGDSEAALTRASQMLIADYFYPYTECAPLEPMNCTALVDDNAVTVWAGTQYAQDAHRCAAAAAGVPIENARLHLTYCGGGFGRRCQNDFVHQAVQIAKAVPGTPVKLIWTREESLRRSYYAPVMVARFQGGLDDSGDITAWTCRAISGQSSDQAYSVSRMPQWIDNVRIEYVRKKTPLPFGWIRGVGFAQTLWMNCSFLDELAYLANRDPLEFNLALLDEALVPDSVTDREHVIARMRNMRRVLNELANRVNWSKPTSDRTGRGLAVFDTGYYSGYHSATKAAMVEVTLDGKGWLTVDRVVIVIDCGQAINPVVVEEQLQGGVAFALTNALYSKITLDGGKVVEGNFHQYKILKMAEMPRVEIHILPSTNHPVGVGEDSVPITMAALINAIFAAGGPRIRSLPIRDQDLTLRSKDIDI